MRLAVRTTITAIVGLSLLLAAALSAAAVYLADLEWRQSQAIVDDFEVAIEANGLAQDVQKTAAQVMAVLLAEDAAAARDRSIELQRDLRKVAESRTSLLSRVGAAMSASDKARLSLRIDEFIAYQADTAKLCLELSPKAAIIQANDRATVVNRQNMLADVQRLSQDMLVNAAAMRTSWTIGRRVRLAMQQTVPAATVAIGALVAIMLLRRRNATRQKRRYDVAMNNMPLGICMADENGVLTIVNDRLPAFFGIETDLSGQSIRRLAEEIAASAKLVDQDRAAFMTQFGRLFEAPFPTPFVAELGERQFEIRCHQMDDGGRLIVIDDVTAARRASQKIERLAMFDALTGLSNRFHFRDQLAASIEMCGNGKRTFSLLILDLDAFKEVNDSLGHPAGDRLLCQVADRLKATVGEAGLVARFGGDEFGVILAPTVAPSELDGVCHRLIAAISAPYQIDRHSVVIGASIGTASFPRDAATAEAIVKCADIALYRSKSLGRCCFRHFDLSMQVEAMQRRQIECDLRAAIVKNELELFYQPIVDVRDNRVHTFEALLRWRHPTRGLISPDAFIPIAEETGLIVEIGEWVVERACRDATVWPDDIRVAVNFSPVQFRRCDVVALIARTLAAAGLAPDRLEVEVTEAILIRDAEATCVVFDDLRRLGVRLCLDDFGSGYSSLSYLNKFPFDKIKIDRAFVSDMHNPKSLAVITAITQLAERLNLSLVVEGVESEEQLAILTNRGIHHIQGYLFSRPRPFAELLPVAASACAAPTTGKAA
ncbi:diguanylate cyclase (GGDEF)-like protein [Rhodoblastus acidophilus]|uniref:putative bifunctional diguanylate cyclase/phosphodiesterase n=1 Tax=Rhodoblastus acidophilus TaxID=1074 RepID=UPI002224B525|nr:EAL domain-containing protein [Rhodoblastus acidophilus]MCW2318921.1 diguanylate cyclase (GGDEF)-like protein [Rhodoblastus acidophilus]